jgi:hypothetical protein
MDTKMTNVSPSSGSTEKSVSKVMNGSSLTTKVAFTKDTKVMNGSDNSGSSSNAAVSRINSHSDGSALDGSKSGHLGLADLGRSNVAPISVKGVVIPEEVSVSTRFCNLLMFAVRESWLEALELGRSKRAVLNTSHEYFGNLAIFGLATHNLPTWRDDDEDDEEQIATDLWELILATGGESTLNAMLHGQTPLMAAVECGSEFITRLLCQHPAVNVNIQSPGCNNDTPLMLAIRSQCGLSIEALLTRAKDIDWNLKNNDGDTTEMCVSRHCSGGFAHLLRQRLFTARSLSLCSTSSPSSSRLTASSSAASSSASLGLSLSPGEGNGKRMETDGSLAHLSSAFEHREFRSLILDPAVGTRPIATSATSATLGASSASVLTAAVAAAAVSSAVESNSESESDCELDKSQLASFDHEERSGWSTAFASLLNTQVGSNWERALQIGRDELVHLDILHTRAFCPFLGLATNASSIHSDGQTDHNSRVTELFGIALKMCGTSYINTPAGHAAFTEAILRESSLIVKLMIECEQTCLDFRNTNGATPLMIAIEGQSSEIVELLLQQVPRLDLNLADNAGKTAEFYLHAFYADNDRKDTVRLRDLHLAAAKRMASYKGAASAIVHQLFSGDICDRHICRDVSLIIIDYASLYVSADASCIIS